MEPPILYDIFKIRSFNSLIEGIMADRRKLEGINTIRISIKINIITYIQLIKEIKIHITHKKLRNSILI